MKVEFVDSQREEHGVQPVLEALARTPAEIAPSTYYAAKSRPESARAARARELTGTIKRVHKVNYGVYEGAQGVEAAEPGRRRRGPVHCRTAHARERAAWLVAR